MRPKVADSTDSTAGSRVEELTESRNFGGILSSNSEVENRFRSPQKIVNVEGDIRAASSSFVSCRNSEQTLD